MPARPANVQDKTRLVKAKVAADTARPPRSGLIIKPVKSPLRKAKAPSEIWSER